MQLILVLCLYYIYVVMYLLNLVMLATVVGSTDKIGIIRVNYRSN